MRFLNTQTYEVDYTTDARAGYISISKSGNMITKFTEKIKIDLINPQTKEKILSIPVSPGGINSLTFSPDEKYLAVNFGQGKVIKVYEISTGNNIFEYNPTGYAIVGIGISPDQKYLVTSSGNIFLYKFLPTTGIDDNPEQKEEIIYPNPTNGLISIRFNNSIPGFTKVIIYDNTGREVKPIFQGHLERGEQNIQGDIRGLKTGNYFVKVSSIGTDISFKLIINK